jgi:lipid-binding SYLF domain-containing protein
MKCNSIAALSAALAGLMVTTAVVAASKADIDAGVARTRHEFNHLNPENHGLAGKAYGELVFPQLTKGGVGVAGEFGEGALVVHGKTQAYYSLTAASIGLTLGGSQHSEILLFMTKDALDNFESSKGWSVGADAGVALISSGSNNSYDTETLKKPILAFVFGEKGLIGDASVEGAKISQIVR